MSRSPLHQSSRFLSLILIASCGLQTSLSAAEKLVDQQGTIQKIGNVGFVIVPDQQRTRYAPSNLDEKFQQNGQRVVFSGEVGKLPRTSD